MRTNIVIEDNLMSQAMKLSGISTKRQTVEEALKLFIRVKGQKAIKQAKGKLHWEGDLASMRSD